MLAARVGHTSRHTVRRRRPIFSRALSLDTAVLSAMTSPCLAFRHGPQLTNLRCELTPAADALRKRKAAVSRLLRRVGAVARPTPVTPPATASPPQSARPESPKKSHPKTPKKSPSTPTSNPGKSGKAEGEDEEKEQGSPKKGKKKKKKKKKATLANEGNPHHIDKCRSTSALSELALRQTRADNRPPVPPAKLLMALIRALPAQSPLPGRAEPLPSPRERVHLLSLRGGAVLLVRVLEAPHSLGALQDSGAVRSEVEAKEA